MTEEIFVALGADIDAMAGWLGSYGREDSPDDISWGRFAGEVGVPPIQELFRDNGLTQGLGPDVAHTTGPVGAIAGSALLSLILSIGASMTAAFIAGSLWLFLSGGVMVFTRHVRQHGADVPVTGAVVP